MYVKQLLSLAVITGVSANGIHRDLLGKIERALLPASLGCIAGDEEVAGCCPCADPNDGICSLLWCMNLGDRLLQISDSCDCGQIETACRQIEDLFVLVDGLADICDRVESCCDPGTTTNNDGVNACMMAAIDSGEITVPNFDSILPGGIPNLSATGSGSCEEEEVTVDDAAPFLFDGIDDATSMHLGRIDLLWDFPTDEDGEILDLDTVRYHILSFVGSYDFASALANTTAKGLISEFDDESRNGNGTVQYHHIMEGESFEFSFNTTFIGKLHTCLVIAESDGLFSGNSESTELHAASSNPVVKKDINIVGINPAKNLKVTLGANSGELELDGLVGPEHLNLVVGDYVHGFTSELEIFTLVIVRIIEMTDQKVVLATEEAQVEAIYDSLDYDSSFALSRPNKVEISPSSMKRYRHHIVKRQRRKMFSFGGIFKPIENVVNNIVDGVTDVVSTVTVSTVTYGSSFNLNQDTACRTRRGGKGSEASGDFDLIKDVSLQACNRKCLNKGKQCFGYEYSTRKKKCEVWKVPIGETKLEYVRGTKCYIKTNGDTPEPSPYPTEAPTFDPTDDTYYFDLNQGMGCRTRRGGKGSEASGDFDLIDDVSRQACKKKCLNKGKKCFGYEYSSRKKECEVWKVPIGESNLQYERGKECYIKTNSDTPEPTPYFDFNQDMGCRTSEGKKGSQKNGDFALYKRVTLGMCEGECLKLGQLCSGYEYGSNGRCEVWKVHIDRIKLEHVRGNDCYIRV